MDKKLIAEVVKAAKFYYPTDVKLQASAIGRAFGNKLAYLDALYNKIIMSNDSVNVFDKSILSECKLLEMDMVGFEQIEQYATNKTKFNELDQLIKKKLKRKDDKRDDDNDDNEEN